MTPPPRPVVWLVPAAAVLAVIGALSPWFAPTATRAGHDDLMSRPDLYSWRDGKIGLLAPILLVLLAVGFVGLLQDRQYGAFFAGPDPARSAARLAILGGAISLLCLAISWFVVPAEFRFGARSWSQVESAGVELGRGPQLGFWLTGAAAILAILAGAGMLGPPLPRPAGARR